MTEFKRNPKETLKCAQMQVPEKHYHDQQRITDTEDSLEKSVSLKYMHCEYKLNAKRKKCLHT